jgi:hypothetical protein
MTVVRGTLTTSLESAERTTRRVAAHQGMTYFAPGSRPGMLVFRTGMLGSGPRLTVSLIEGAPSAIEATITTGGTFALTGWGRGKTTANRFLRALIAQTESEASSPGSR